jgi:hypothetical protein
MYLLPEYVHDHNDFNAAGRTTEGSWFDPWQGQEIFLFSKRPDLHWAYTGVYLGGTGDSFSGS